ncbi:hypothetical protein N2152v2_005783 [Parachlorella kessleri]
MAPALPLCCVNHISRVVTDVGKSTAFYRDVLGFTEVQRPSSFEFGGSWLWNYQVGIHLIEGAPVARPSVIDPKADHLSFQADSLEDVQQRLEELGIAYVKQVILEGGVQVFFHDPDNNMIEVCNCNCLPIVPLECALACRTCSLPGRQPAAKEQLHADVAAAAVNNLADQCDSLHDSADEYDPME